MYHIGEECIIAYAGNHVRNHKGKVGNRVLVGTIDEGHKSSTVDGGTSI